MDLTQQNQEEIKKIVELLRQFAPGLLPYDVFVQIARLTVLPIVELVPLRLSAAGKIEVLLLPRSKDDEFWPDQLHTPGTVLRADDAVGGIKRAFDRIVQDELKGTKVSEPVFVDQIFQKSNRGAEFAQIYYARVEDNSLAGTFYDSQSLPSNLIETQKIFINKTVEAFQKSLRP